MTIKDVFNQNKGKIIVIWHNRTYQLFHDYKDCVAYFNNYFGDKIVNEILNNNIMKCSVDFYSLNVKVKLENFNIYIEEKFQIDVGIRWVEYTERAHSFQ